MMNSTMYIYIYIYMHITHIHMSCILCMTLLPTNLAKYGIRKGDYSRETVVLGMLLIGYPASQTYKKQMNMATTMSIQ